MTDEESMRLRGDVASEEKAMRLAHEKAEKPWPPNYNPTDWVRSVVGNRFRGWDGRTYKCTAYDPNSGFWMLAEDRVANISERAIGRTYHQIYYSPDPKTAEEL